MLNGRHPSWVNRFLSPDVQDVHRAAVWRPGCRGDEVCCRGGFQPDSAAPTSEPQTHVTADPLPDQQRLDQSERPHSVRRAPLRLFLPLLAASCHGSLCWDDRRHCSARRQRLRLKFNGAETGHVTDQVLMDTSYSSSQTHHHGRILWLDGSFWLDVCFWERCHLHHCEEHFIYWCIT